MIGRFQLTQKTRDPENEKIFEELYQRFGYKLDPEKIMAGYCDGIYRFKFRNEDPDSNFSFQIRDASMNKLTLLAIKYGSENTLDPYLCLFVKDLLIAFSKNLFKGNVQIIEKATISEKSFGLFASWIEKLDLNKFNIKSDFFNPILKLECSSECVPAKLGLPSNEMRYIPRNFKIEELSSLLLMTGDFPKNIETAKSLFNEKKRKLNEQTKTARLGNVFQSISWVKKILNNGLRTIEQKNEDLER